MSPWGGRQRQLGSRAGAGVLGWRAQTWVLASDLFNTSVNVAPNRQSASIANDQYETPVLGYGANGAVRGVRGHGTLEIGVDLRDPRADGAGRRQLEAVRPHHPPRRSALRGGAIRRRPSTRFASARRPQSSFGRSGDRGRTWFCLSRRPISSMLRWRPERRPTASSAMDRRGWSWRGSRSRRAAVDPLRRDCTRRIERRLTSAPACQIWR
jgi:hypothetical protein